MEEKLRIILRKRLPYVHGHIINAIVRDILKLFKEVRKNMVLTQVEIDRKAVLVAKETDKTITEAEKVELQAFKDKEAR